MKKIILSILGMLLLLGAYAQQPNQTLMINTDARVDSTGNVTFEVSGKLTAQQWIAWNYMYGGGQASMVKRNIERTLSPFYVYEFKYLPNEMDRTFQIQYKVKGTVEYLGKDKWKAIVGLKDAQPVKLSENTFNCVLSEPAGNIIIQNTMKVILPPDATNMQFDKDEFSNVIVLYNRPTENVIISGDKNMKTAGYSLIGTAIIASLVIAGMRKKIIK